MAQPDDFSALSLAVDVVPGCDIPGMVIPQICALAKHLNMRVTAKVNGVNLSAWPTANPSTLAIVWRRACENGSTGAAD